ncbi:hypothetical protein BDC45DRAFT_542521 [Circinella umbellata]|nr:hypothetical protein BDC45DRAFT_542521 [Circinella umbellata]
MNANHEAILSSIEMLSTKLIKESQNLHECLYNIEEKIELLDMEIKNLNQLKDIPAVQDIERLDEGNTIDWIMHPQNEDGKDDVLNDESVINFIHDYSELYDEKKERKLKQDILKIVRWTCNDVEETIVHGDKNKKLPTWKRLSSDNKKLMLNSVTEEVQKRGLPCHRCQGNWFIHHLVYNCWHNKAKYRNKKIKQKLTNSNTENSNNIDGSKVQYKKNKTKKEQKEQKEQEKKTVKEYRSLKQRAVRMRIYIIKSEWKME